VKLGSDKFILSRGSELIKSIYIIYGVKFYVQNDEKMSKTGLKKNRRFVIFRVHFLPILSLLGPIAIYRKTAPTKSTVLGPDPPLGFSINLLIFIEFLRF
jgi:hypothetical protein